MVEYPTWRRLAGAMGMVLILVVVITVCLLSFSGTFDKTIRVVVTSERAGLILNPGAKVKVDGVEVGKVTAIESRGDEAKLILEVNSDQAKGIAGNSGAQIAATTVFGAKFVDLTVPSNPVGSLAPNTVIQSSNVTTEVNTVFQDIVDVTNAISPQKLKATVSALAEGLRGQGRNLGTAFNQLNRVLVRFNSEIPVFTDDVSRTARVARIYAGVGPDLVRVLDSGATTSNSIVRHAADIDQLLASSIGLGTTGTDVLSKNKENTVALLRALTPTTALLNEYRAVLACTPREAYKDFNRVQRTGAGNTGYSLDLDVSLLLGDDAYKSPQNLPVVAGKGGPYGKPGCYPTITPQNAPAPYLVINDGGILNGKGTYSPRLGDPLFTNYLFGNLGNQP